jgi:hypothetical protein
MTAREKPALWQCPECEERFTTRNQWHSCGSFQLDDLFARCDPKVRRLFDELVKIVQECGPVTVIPQKTRIAFQARMRFAAVTPQRMSLRGHLVLAQPYASPCFEKVESISPRNHLHVFRIESDSDLANDFGHWVREAYKVGCQEHLDKNVRRRKKTT